MKTKTVTLAPLTPDDRERFILDNQEAFRFGAMEEFCRRDDHMEEDGEIISRATIERCIDGEHSEALRILEETGRDLAGLMVPDRPVRFDFLVCGESSLNLDGYVWFNAPDWFGMRSSRSRFNQEVVRRFTEAGLAFAYPTSTVYLENRSETSGAR